MKKNQSKNPAFVKFGNHIVQAPSTVKGGEDIIIGDLISG